jgi:hypothetical protein
LLHKKTDYKRGLTLTHVKHSPYRVRSKITDQNIVQKWANFFERIFCLDESPSQDDLEMFIFAAIAVYKWTILNLHVEVTKDSNKKSKR